MKIRHYISFLFLLLILACQSGKDKKEAVFQKLDPGKSKITFANTITESGSLNILDYLYFYNGGGVASADFNNDGLEDLYFISNQSSNKLYLNKGGLVFDDITEKAGLKGAGSWKTGVTVVDINSDGYKDIYVSVVSGYKGFQGKNQLYINNGNLTFTESAEKWGVDFAGLSTQAAFFDYDKDGDLDLFILTHSAHSNDAYGDSTQRFKYSAPAGDHLYRNDGGRFSEIISGSGIYASAIGYGLGLSISDLNNDGWDDIYVSNDFFEQDYYYLNQQDGTFKEKLKEAFGHTSLFSMGNAVSDINKDGSLDVITTDMLPEDIKALKSSINDEPLDIYNQQVRSGFHYQYTKNCLQLNVGNGQKFVDIGLYAGISATDWTWSPLVEDFDMDGIKDLFFSNGILKRLNDLDYLKYLGDANVFKNYNSDRTFDQDKIARMPEGRVHNYFYRGDTSLRFTDESVNNDMQDVTASAGALTVDLDNDGDLEIVTNNMNEPAFIYQNKTIEQSGEKMLRYLKYAVRYKKGNIDGIGTKIYMKSAQAVDHQEVQTSGAFQSSKSSNLLFTFRPDDTPTEALIVWPDNSYQTVKNFRWNKKQLIRYDPERVNGAPGRDVSAVISNFIKSKAEFESIAVKVQEIAAVQTAVTPDFNYYSLLPHTYSKLSPAIAVADINRDDLDDIYVGGIAGQEKYLLIAGKSGYKKVAVAAFEPFRDISDHRAEWVDLDNDQDLDLVITNSEHPFTDADKLKPNRIYINEGNFQFRYQALPAINTLTSELCVLDVNNDGLKDIIMMSAVSFRNYTKLQPSYIFLNAGSGSFRLTEEKIYDELRNIPYVKNITLADADNDGRQDLFIASEWNGIRILLNNGKGFQKRDIPLLENLKGWWQCTSVADVDNDGKPDLLAGNWGLNNKYNVSPDYPLYAYNDDLDKNEKNDLLLSYNVAGKYYPFRPKNDLEQEMPYLKKEWLSYQKMADKTTGEIFKDRLNEKTKLAANEFRSIFISDVMHAEKLQFLPFLYQQAPIVSFTKGRAPGEVIVNGNFGGTVPYEGKYDALGLVTMKYDQKKKQISSPVYWLNPKFNFQEAHFIKPVRSGAGLRWLILTDNGKLLLVNP